MNRRTPILPAVPTGTFQSPRRAASAEPNDGWLHEDSDIYQLVLPAGPQTSEVFDDIESALLAAADQLHRAPSSPELPPLADRYRRKS